MGFKMKGFPMQAGTSPMRQAEDKDAATSNAGHVVKTGNETTTTETKEVKEDENAAGNFADAGITAPSAEQIATDEKTAKDAERNALNDKEAFDGTGGEKDVTDETRAEASKNAWRNTGGGHIYAAGESIVKGIKNMRAKRKARKAGELTDAQNAVTGGTANLKQTKLVDKTNEKTTKAKDKATKDKAKDDKKLKKYNAKKTDKAAKDKAKDDKKLKKYNAKKAKK